MAGLLITSQNPRPGAKRASLSAMLVAGWAFAVADELEAILSRGHQPLSWPRSSGDGPWPNITWDGFNRGLSVKCRVA